MDSPLTGDMPSEVFLRLPEPAIYISTPGEMVGEQSVHGSWVALEYDVNDGRKELRFLLDTDNGLAPLPLHIGSWSVQEGLERFLAESTRQTLIHRLPTHHVENKDFFDWLRLLQHLLPLVLYLCSEEPEIDSSIPGKRPAYPKLTHVKKGWRLFPPTKPVIWDVGLKIGVTLRQDAQKNKLNTAERHHRAHLRRGHWHGYWTGQGRTVFIYRWIAPLIAGGKSE